MSEEEEKEQQEVDQRVTEVLYSIIYNLPSTVYKPPFIIYNL